MKQVAHELRWFVVAGVLAVLTDLSSYYLLLEWLPPSAAKTFSFLCGTAVAYLLNKFLTFRRPRKSYREMAAFLLLYSTTLLVNVGVNKVSLVLFPGMVFLAFLFATGTSTILNFLGQKFWVFRF